MNDQFSRTQYIVGSILLVAVPTTAAFLGFVDWNKGMNRKLATAILFLGLFLDVLKFYLLINFIIE